MGQCSNEKNKIAPRVYLHLPAIMLFWGQYKKAIFYQYDSYNKNDTQNVIFKDLKCFKDDNISPTCPI